MCSSVTKLLLYLAHRRSDGGRPSFSPGHRVLIAMSKVRSSLFTTGLPDGVDQGTIQATKYFRQHAPPKFIPCRNSGTRTPLNGKVWRGGRTARRHQRASGEGSGWRRMRSTSDLGTRFSPPGVVKQRICRRAIQRRMVRGFTPRSSATSPVRR